jgi:hypothetical protein
VDSKGGKLLGMPRNVGIIVVIGGIALLAYIYLSRNKTSSSSGSSGGSSGQPEILSVGGGGSRTFTEVVREQQGHQPKPPNKLAS